MLLSEILNESLPLSTAKEYRRAWEDDNRNVFRAFSKYAIDRNMYRIKFKLKDTQTLDGEDFGTMIKVYNTLSDFTAKNTDSYEFITNIPIRRSFVSNTMVLSSSDKQMLARDYIDGYIYDKERTKRQRIGKTLNDIIVFFTKFITVNEEHLKNTKMGKEVVYDLIREHCVERVRAILREFLHDPLRGPEYNKEPLYVIVSRHPYDIAGMSTGRGWTSCTNINDGEKSHVPMGEVKNRSLVAYLVKEGDNNIDHPIARIMIAAVKGSDGEVAYVASSDIYGLQSDRFREFVKRFARILNKNTPDIIYTAPAGAYMSSMRYKKNKDGNMDVWWAGS